MASYAQRGKIKSKFKDKNATTNRESKIQESLLERG